MKISILKTVSFLTFVAFSLCWGSGRAFGENAYVDDFPPVAATAQLSDILALYGLSLSAVPTIKSEIIHDAELCSPLQDRFEVSLNYQGYWKQKPIGLRFLVLLRSKRQFEQMVARLNSGNGIFPSCLLADIFRKTAWSISLAEVTFQPVNRTLEVQGACHRTKSMPSELPEVMSFTSPYSLCALESQ